MRAVAGPTGTKRRWTVLGMAVAAGLVGCVGDSKLAVGEPRAELADYCAKSLALETSPEPGIDLATTTPEQVQAAWQAYAAQLVPLAEDVAAAAPAEIKTDLDVLAGATRTIVRTGDLDALAAAAVSAASARVDAFDLENCGWGDAKVTGAEYEFEGLPGRSEAGPVRFNLRNVGKEPHELELLRINDGVEESLAELLALPDDEAFTKVEPFGGTGPVDPGADGNLVVELTPGRYAVVCFIPVGGGEDGPRHFTEGMKGELEVG